MAELPPVLGFSVYPDGGQAHLMEGFQVRSPVQRRRALCIGVGSAAGEVWHRGLGPVHLAPLLSASSEVHDMAASLEHLGYVCTVSVDATSSRMREQFWRMVESLDDTDLLIVYFIGHVLGTSYAGERTLVGAQEPGEGGSRKSIVLDEWINAIERGNHSPRTLFLIDGYDVTSTVGRYLRPGQRTSLIVATTRESHADPFASSTFTQAACRVMHGLRSGGLHIDRSLPYVPVQTFARRLAEELGRSDPADRIHLEWTGSGSIDELPFFPNPAHAGFGPGGAHREPTRPAVLPDIEEIDAGVDVQHFLDRASGASVVAEHSRGLVGLFTGRVEELRRLADWLNGSERFMVVTGAPGAGKSALLGLFVAATHPQLREGSQSLWTVAEHVQFHAFEDLVAVHARQRDVAGVCQSIGNQLGVEDVSSPERLLDVLRRRVRPPVIVIDALDEIADHQNLMMRLLLPVIQPDGPDGRPAGRVVVSMRRLPDFASVLRRAADSGNLIDLDTVPAETLISDLRDYVTSVLRTTREFRHRGAVVNAFAQGVASTLTAQSQPNWGVYLVAGLYSRWFANSKLRSASDNPSEAARVGHDVPTSLIEVLDLDLRSQDRQSQWLRPALTALASASGLGMPLSVLARVAPVFAPGFSSEPSENELARSLESARFYLRSVSDTDGAALYRIFHQAVADHLLKSSPVPASVRADTILNRLLAPLGPSGMRDWTVAEPYVLRHALPLATAAGRRDDILWDPGFLLYSHPQTVSTEAERHDTGTLPRSVWIALCDPSREVPERLFAAILAAHRDDQNALAERLARLPGAPNLSLHPQWTRPHRGEPRSIAVVPPRDGGVVLVLHRDRRVEVFDSANGKKRPASSLDCAPVVGVQLIDLAGRTFVLVTRSDRTQQLWDARNDVAVPAAHHFDTVRPNHADHLPAAVAVFDGRLVEITGTRAGGVEIVDALTRTPRLEETVFSGTPVTALTAWDDGDELTVLVANNAGVILTWRPGRSRPLRLMDLSAPVHAVTLAGDGGLFVATETEIIAFRVADDMDTDALGGRLARR